MGLADRLWRRRGEAPPALELVATTLTVIPDDRTFQAADGSTVHSLGYTLVGPDGESARVAADDWLAEVGCRLCEVAELARHPDGAQDDQVKPGAVVLLAPDPGAPDGRQAVGVWAVSGEQQIGLVRPDDSAELLERIAAGELLGAAILREHRTMPKGGRRIALVILVAPAGTVTLKVLRGPAAGGAGRPASAPL